MHGFGGLFVFYFWIEKKNEIFLKVRSVYVHTALRTLWEFIMQVMFMIIVYFLYQWYLG